MGQPHRLPPELEIARVGAELLRRGEGGGLSRAGNLHAFHCVPGVCC